MVKRCASTGEKLARWRDLPWYEPLPARMYVGLPGAGKSLQMVQWALRQMSRGRRVWANVPIWHRPAGLRAGHVESWEGMLEIARMDDERDKIIIVQDAGNVCNARDWGKLPVEVRDTWNTLRHFGVQLVLDAQHELKVDLALRQVVEDVIICEPTGCLRWGLRVYRQTHTDMQTCQRVRMALAVGELNEYKELDVVPPGRSHLVPVWGWQHQAYDTHYKVRSWTYGDDSRVVVPPTRWDRQLREWVAL